MNDMYEKGYQDGKEMGYRDGIAKGWHDAMRYMAEQQKLSGFQQAGVDICPKCQKTNLTGNFCSSWGCPNGPEATQGKNVYRET